jgi:ankyrin repeat protein
VTASRNHLDVAKILLKHGANKDDKNRSSKTSADLARENDHANIANLIDNYDDGLDVKQPDQES